MFWGLCRCTMVYMVIHTYNETDVLCMCCIRRMYWILRDAVECNVSVMEGDGRPACNTGKCTT